MRLDERDPHSTRQRLTHLTGVVLCGGESRRMGRDKGLLPIGDSCWAVHMAGKMAAWQIPVVYSINLRQEASYGAVISPELLVIDAIGLPGPLEGLFSVHKKLPGRDLLLLACDMPDLDTATVATLLDAYREEGDKSAFFVFQDGSSFAEPFCGIYTAAGLAGAYQLAVAGKLSDLSLQSLLRRGPTKKIPITNKDVFRNYNEKGPAY